MPKLPEKPFLPLGKWRSSHCEIVKCVAEVCMLILKCDWKARSSILILRLHKLRKKRRWSVSWRRPGGFEAGACRCNDAKKLQCVPQAIRAMKFLQLEDTHLRCVGLGLRPWQRSSIGLRRPVRSLVSLYARYSWYNLGKQISSKNFEVRNLNPWNKLASNSDSLLWQLEVCRAFWQICLIWVFWVSFFHQSHGMTCR